MKTMSKILDEKLTRENAHHLLDYGFEQGPQDFLYYKDRIMINASDTGITVYYVTDGWDTNLAGHKIKSPLEIWEDDSGNTASFFDRKTLNHVLDLHGCLMGENL